MKTRFILSLIILLLCGGGFLCSQQPNYDPISKQVTWQFVPSPCGDSTHALGWNIATYGFYCQTLSGGGGGGIGGSGTTGFLPLFTDASDIGNSHVDDGHTTPGKVTSSEPIVAQLQDKGGQVWNALALGFHLDNTTDDCAAYASARTLIRAAGGGTLYIPAFGYALLSSCGVDSLDANMTILGSGMTGTDIGTTSVAPSGLHITHVPTGGNVAVVQLLGNGAGDTPANKVTRGGLKNLTIINDTPAAPCILVTGMNPEIENVTCIGQTSAVGGTPTNGGIQLGSTSPTLVPGSPASNYGGYAGEYIRNFYCINCTWIAQFLNTANGITDASFFGDYTDSDPTGYAVVFNGTGAGEVPYGNTIKVQIEGGPVGGGSVLYKGGVGFGVGSGGYSGNNIVDLVVGDTGTEQHGAWILSANSQSNTVICHSPNSAYVNGECINDVSTSYGNGWDDTNIRTFARQNYRGVNLGSPTYPFNFLFLNGGGSVEGLEGTPATTCGVNRDYLWADTTDHRWKVCNNNGTPADVATILSGSQALGTSSIAANACASAISIASTGVVTTDVILITPNADISGVTGYGPLSTDGLTVNAYPTAGHVNIKVCNTTGTAIVPGAVTVNWSVPR